MRADYDMSGITAYGYTFQQVVADSGLMDYKARAYDPFLQKFIQPDTVVAEPGSSQGYNRYVYVNNDPVNLTDPTGNRPCDDGNLDGLCDAPLVSRGSGDTLQNNNPLQIPCGGILGSLEGATCNNVNQALNILGNPRATNTQKFWSGYYVAVVVNTHVAIGVGLTIAGWELVTGAGTTCAMNPQCGEELKITYHAIERMIERDINFEQIEKVLQQQPFTYLHEGILKTGFYDPELKTFIAMYENTIITVISNVNPQYIKNLLEKVK